MKTVLFGAGKIGKKAIKSEIFMMKSCIFCDNYSGEKVIDGIKVIKFSELERIYNCETEIIITSSYFQDIYKQCYESNMKVSGIYDGESQTVKSYYEYCLDRNTGYSNGKFIDYMIRKEKIVEDKVNDFKQGNSLSECMTEVAIMISNVCNYSSIHKQCPASLYKEKNIMSFDNIKYIVDSLESIGFTGTICFHIYNEPMNDPRLFMIIQYVKNRIPTSTILLYTNGFYLTNTICRELSEIGVEVVITTAYGKSEYERLMKLETSIAYHVLYGRLDDRLLNYDNKETVPAEGRCRSLISQLPIYVNGDIGICCLDYKHNYGLGNVFEEEFVSCINKKTIRDFQMNLLDGRIKYKICSVCGWRI